MIPLEQFVKGKNLGDPSEFSYVGQRCSTLYSLIGGLFRENGTSKDSQTITTMESRSTVVRNVSLSFDLGVNKKSSESIIKQSKLFSEIYTQQLIKNKQLNNNYFDGYIKTDLEICNSLYPQFEELNKKVPK
ncbi:hypothetical protein M2131_001541 [Polynucleobacter sphagniphilus]|uniref:hypothetical protein n=1 Tax=Polynucleobacter sphagniphilus TaxID=1743169 RepID=UPI0024743209|nr:hypothetical protein [Polynucleobacter sphagniphilus]MDH6421600.1 hypothetical protein [Polynucleobacter sphagniphilus]